MNKLFVKIVSSVLMAALMFSPLPATKTTAHDCLAPNSSVEAGVYLPSVPSNPLTVTSKPNQTKPNQTKPNALL